MNAWIQAMQNMFRNRRTPPALRKGPSTRAGYAGGSESWDPLGRGGPAGMRDVLERYFIPELNDTRKLSAPIRSAFLEQTLEPGALYGAASTAAQGYANQIFAPGGEIAGQIRTARGGATQAGFAPEAAEGTERAILRSGLQRVGDVFAQQAGALEQARYGGLTGAFGETQAARRDLMESLFTGVSSAESLALSQKAMKQNRPKFLGIF